MDSRANGSGTGAGSGSSSVSGGRLAMDGACMNDAYGDSLKMADKIADTSSSLGSGRVAIDGARSE